MPTATYVPSTVHGKGEAAELLLKKVMGVVRLDDTHLTDSQILRVVIINDLPIGQDVDETPRLVQAIDLVDKHG
ncbi:thioredoxin peroxidase [Nannochloropsis oceanica]